MESFQIRLDEQEEMEEMGEVSLCLTSASKEIGEVSLCLTSSASPLPHFVPSTFIVGDVGVAVNDCGLVLWDFHKEGWMNKEEMKEIGEVSLCLTLCLTSASVRLPSLERWHNEQLHFQIIL